MTLNLLSIKKIIQPETFKLKTMDVAPLWVTLFTLTEWKNTKENAVVVPGVYLNQI